MHFLQILSQKNDVEGALQAVRAALKLSPDEKSLKSELARLEERERKDGKKERDLAKKMMGSTESKKSADKAAQPKDGGSNKKKVN